jgi:hypothetical protein
MFGTHRANCARAALLVALSPLVALAQQPVTLHVAPVSSRIAEYQPAELDRLLGEALAASKSAKGASETVAEVLVRPEVLRTDSGKVRVLFSLKRRTPPDATDRVAFEFGSTRFGPVGVTQMLNGVAARATALRDRPAPVASSGTGSGGATAGDSGGTTATSDVPFGQEPPPEPPEPMRFRWGLSAGAGTFIPGPMLAFGGELRAGVQLNRMFSVYGSFAGSAGFLIGGSVTGTGGSLNVGAEAFYAFGVQGEAVFFDMLYVAGGPQVARGGWGFIGQAVDLNGGVSQRVYAAAGWMPAFDLKVGFGFGSRNEKTGRRNHFTVAIDTMFLFAPNTVTGSQVVNMNGVSQSVDVRGVAVGVAPLLVLGFDGR